MSPSEANAQRVTAYVHALPKHLGVFLAFLPDGICCVLKDSAQIVNQFPSPFCSVHLSYFAEDSLRNTTVLFFQIEEYIVEQNY